jgi:hypothetical protein
MEIETAILQSIGMYILAIIIAVIAAFAIRGIVIAIRPPEEGRKAAAPAPAPAARTEDPARNDVAVIAAAVYAMLGAHRIVRIQPSISSTSWAAQGRMIHHTSHRPGRR